MQLSTFFLHCKIFFEVREDGAGDDATVGFRANRRFIIMIRFSRIVISVTDSIPAIESMIKIYFFSALSAYGA